jgi:hypothetical protein
MLMRKHALIVAASLALTATPWAATGAGATPNYCYTAKPAAEGGCVYKAPAAETVTISAAGGWGVLVKHGKKITEIKSANPEVPTTFQLDLAKKDTVTLSITHIGSAITLVDGQ